MTIPDEIQISMAQAAHESAALWHCICDEADGDRSQMLAEKMQETFALLMNNENNATVTMALVGFLSAHLMGLSREANMSEFGALMLIQTGLQRGVAAQVAMLRAVEEASQHEVKN